MTTDAPQGEAHESRLHRLARRLAENDPSLRFPRRMRVAMTVGPFVGFALILAVASIASGFGAVMWLAGIELGSFVGGGKFVIFSGVLRDVIMGIFGDVPSTAPPSPWVLAGMVVYGDIATASVLLANMGVLYVGWRGWAWRCTWRPRSRARAR